MEYLVHQSHKSGRSISKSEWKYKEFVMSISSIKSCFLNSIMREAYLVITWTQIYFWEYFGPCKAVEEIFKLWEGVRVLYSQPI